MQTVRQGKTAKHQSQSWGTVNDRLLGYKVVKGSVNVQLGGENTQDFPRKIEETAEGSIETLFENDARPQGPRAGGGKSAAILVAAQ